MKYAEKSLKIFARVCMQEAKIILDHNNSFLLAKNKTLVLFSTKSVRETSGSEWETKENDERQNERDGNANQEAQEREDCKAQASQIEKRDQKTRQP